MSHQMTIHLNEQEYAALGAEAARSGKQPEMLLYEMVKRLQTISQVKRPLTEQEFMEKLYLEGKVLNVPTRRLLTNEEKLERERLAQLFAGGKPASEMVIEDRGTYP
jgi:hypothetical protein